MNRHEEPKTITDEYEQQTCQLFCFHRRKSVFKPFLPASGTEAFSSVLPPIFRRKESTQKRPFCRFLNFSPTPIFKEVMLIFPFQPSENHLPMLIIQILLEQIIFKAGSRVLVLLLCKIDSDPLVIWLKIFCFQKKSSVFKKKSSVFRRNLLVWRKKIFCFQAKASVFKKKSSVFR